jgi:transcriptional regulator with XRE-family HTH domain
MNSIGDYIREQREQAKISLRQLSQAAGVSNPYLSQIERGLRKPSAEILQQIAKGLRISAEALYVQAGILEDRPPGSMVREAVMTDPELTQRQRQMLIEIYESFRKENAAAEATDTPISVLPYAGPAGIEPGLAEVAAEAEAEPWLPPAETEPEPEPAGGDRPSRTGRARRRDGTWAAVTDDATDTGHNG